MQYSDMKPGWYECRFRADNRKPPQRFVMFWNGHGMCECNSNDGGEPVDVYADFSRLDYAKDGMQADRYCPVCRRPFVPVQDTSVCASCLSDFVTQQSERANYET